MPQRLTTGKIKKEYSCHATARKLQGRRRWSKKIQLDFENYNFCKYVKFGVILPRTA